MKGETIKVLDRALEVLKLLAAHPRGLTLTEITNQLGLPITTTRRFLITLAKEDFVQLDPETDRYRLGYALLGLSVLTEISNNLVVESEPVMRALRDQTGETISLRVRTGEKSLVLAVVESLHRVRYVHYVGQEDPIHAGASGKVLLAFLPPKEQDAILEKLELTKFTDQTITDKDALRAALEKVRAQGYAISSGEVSSDSASIAAPILRGDRAIASLAISLPSSRITFEQLDEQVGHLRAACDKLTQRFSSIRARRDAD